MRHNDEVNAIYTPLPTTHNLPRDWPSEPTVTASSVSPELRSLLLSRRDRAHVMVMPRATLPASVDERDAEQTSTYTDLDLLAVETMRRGGVDISTLHDEGERRVSAEFGADVVIALGLFLAQAISEEEILNIYRYIKARVWRARKELAKRDRKGDDVILAVDLLRVKEPNGTEIEVQGVRGPAEQTVELFREVLGSPGQESARD
jgi:hypothetical protein